MECASQTAVFETSVCKVGTAVRTGPAKEPIASLLVAEDHKLFPQKIYRLERPVSAQFVDQSRRLPVTPQHLSGRPIGANAGDAIVLFRAEHGHLQLLLETPAFMGSFVTSCFPSKGQGSVREAEATL